ncbi:MAG: hypothetical protein ACD_24C00509G0002 [uncultured bacterium]|nr:MAG: hypothetical protein ACD_24C00509G0002 [uncultured bacterium]
MSKTNSFEVENVINNNPELSDAVLKMLEVKAKVVDMKPKQAKPKEENIKIDSNFTEFWNAERFIQENKGNIKFCYTRDKWLIWDGIIWLEDSKNQIFQIAKETIKNLHSYASKIQDDDKRSKLIKHALRSENLKSVKNMVKISESEEGIPISSNDFDSNNYYINCLNGMVDLRTGELLPHNKDEYITNLIPINYNPVADYVKWAEFLDSIMDGNRELINFIQRAIGYSLTGSIQEQCFFILYGKGSNGKSTFVDAISKILGSYSKNTPIESLMTKDNKNGIPSDIARLQGARFVTASEPEDGCRLSESLIKQLTGNKTITARFMFGEWFDFEPKFKIWMDANHKPVIRGTDYAIWRRIKLIPFNVTISPEKKDKDLPKKLEKELEGILNWAVMGAMEYFKKGLAEPKEVQAATDEYKTDMDFMEAFLSECTIKSTFKTRVREVYQRYVEWCRDTGEYTQKEKVFNQKMEEREIKKIKSTGGIMFWENISLKVDDEDNPYTK